MQHTRIQEIQGEGLQSPLVGALVAIEGTVTGSTRKGYFVQDPRAEPGRVSNGLFVFAQGSKPPRGAAVRVEGRVVDYVPIDNTRPTTQLDEIRCEVTAERGAPIEPVWLTAQQVLVERAVLAERLNALEGMLVGVEAGSTFAAPSNPFGDYVVLPPGAKLPRTEQGGVLIEPGHPDRWLPGFRWTDYADAPRVHVGAELRKAVTGPLNFRVNSYQIAAVDPVLAGDVAVRRPPTELQSQGSLVTVLTLNGFNLDAHVEDARRVMDPSRDVDDDMGDGRFDSLAQAIVQEAGSPDIVALQEVQDDDGAEITDVVTARRTLSRMSAAIRHAGGPTYRWAEIPPEAGADGGQPGGNIRNAFLYRAKRVELLEGSLHRLGDGHAAFEDSRKVLCGRFRVIGSPGELEVINVHLASKRNQYSLFAPEQPGFDPRLSMRVQQAELIADYMATLRDQGVDYYVTGDFNDFEFTDTLRAICGDHSVNLVNHVPHALRYDYNHRGLSEALMHGVVAKRQLEGRKADYGILHANALIGVHPGRQGGKPSDHAYVIARLQLA